MLPHRGLLLVAWRTTESDLSSDRHVPSLSRARAACCLASAADLQSGAVPCETSGGAPRTHMEEGGIKREAACP